MDQQQEGRHVCEFRTMELAHVHPSWTGGGYRFSTRSGKEGETVFARLLLVSWQDPFDPAHTPSIDQAEPLGRAQPPSCHGLTINLQPAE